MKFKKSINCCHVLNICQNEQEKLKSAVQLGGLQLWMAKLKQTANLNLLTDKLFNVKGPQKEGWH